MDEHEANQDELNQLAPDQPQAGQEQADQPTGEQTHEAAGEPADAGCDAPAAQADDSHSADEQADDETSQNPSEPADEAPAADAATPDDETSDTTQPEESPEDATDDRDDVPQDSFRDPAALVEAILFTTDTALPIAKIAQVAQLQGAKVIRQAIKTLNERYEQMGCSFRIEEIGGGFQMMTLPEYHDALGRLSKARSDSKLSQAALEALAIIAYRQPILRADIEAIRGVASGEILRTLMEKQLVKIVGRAEVIGRPMLYGTTRRFLDVFGLGSLEDLPRVEELKNPREVKPKPAAPAQTEPSAAADQPAPDAPTPTPAQPQDPSQQPGPADAPPENPAQADASSAEPAPRDEPAESIEPATDVDEPVAPPASEPPAGTYQSDQ